MPGVSLQNGLYDLCRKRIAGDELFRKTAKHRNFDSMDEAMFNEYKLFQLQRTIELAEGKSAFYRKLFAEYDINPGEVKSLKDIEKLPFTTPEDISGNSYNFLCLSQGYRKSCYFLLFRFTGKRNAYSFLCQTSRRYWIFFPGA